jgi:hypothetical protein
MPKAVIRMMRERKQYEATLKYEREHRKPNPLCGAVALGWDDLVRLEKRIAPSLFLHFVPSNE